MRISYGWAEEAMARSIIMFPFRVPEGDLVFVASPPTINVRTFILGSLSEDVRGQLIKTIMGAFGHCDSPTRFVEHMQKTKYPPSWCWKCLEGLHHQFVWKNERRRRKQMR